MRIPNRQLVTLKLRPPLIIAHRGAADGAPENTLPAFEYAYQQGADGIEFDLHLSSDGVPVVIHDARLDRTTSGTGLVGACSAKSLRRLDAGSWFNCRHPSKAAARNANLKIPLLSEVLAWVKDRRCRAFLEIKQGGHVYPGIERRVVEAIGRAGVEGWITVTSFHLPTLARLRRLDKNLSLGVNFSHPLGAVAKALTLSAASVHPHGLFTARRFIRRAHRSDLAVIVWGLDEAQSLCRKMVSGVDGLMTRHPARAVALRMALSNFLLNPKSKIQAGLLANHDPLTSHPTASGLCQPPEGAASWSASVGPQLPGS